MKKVYKKMSEEEANFYELISILKKYALSFCKRYRSVYKSTKYDAIIVENHPYLSYNAVVGKEYMRKRAEFEERKISLKDWNVFLKDFSRRYPGKIERASHKFKLFIYLENHNFCVDISENGVRTKIMEVPMPDKITGDPNGKLALSFEGAIKEQIVKYISQTQTNIEVLKRLT